MEELKKEKSGTLQNDSEMQEVDLLGTFSESEEFEFTGREDNEQVLNSAPKRGGSKRKSNVLEDSDTESTKKPKARETPEKSAS